MLVQPQLSDLQHSSGTELHIKTHSSPVTQGTRSQRNSLQEKKQFLKSGNYRHVYIPELKSKLS